MSTIPSTPTSVVWPDWTNLVDKWREEDAEWLRNRVINIVADATERDSVLTSGIRFDGLTVYNRSLKRLEFWNGTAWETAVIRSLAISDTTATATLERHKDAGTGLTFNADGSVAAGGVFSAGPGVLSVAPAGVSIKTGAKTALLSTDATSLKVDSPVAVTGAVSASGGFQGALTGNVAATTVAASGAITGGSAAISGGVTAGTLLVGSKAQLVAGGSSVDLVNTAAGATDAFVRIADSDAVTVKGASVVLQGPVSADSKVTAAAGVEMQASTSKITAAGMTSPQVAGIVTSTSAASGNYPDGTIWIQVS